MNKVVVNSMTIEGIKDINSTIKAAMYCKKISASQLARMSGIEWKTIHHLCNDLTYACHLANYIQLLDVLGFDEVTITWRNE